MHDAKQARQLFHEIEVLKRVRNLKNPNLLRFHACHEDVSSSTGLPRLSIVTDMCSGGELFDRIVAAGHYSEKNAAGLVARLVRAFQDLHSHGILHRDLKPENVLYASKAEDAEPILADFGLSRLADRPDVHGGLVGTPGYVSPEIVREKRYTPAGDVWALGVLTYILLCGYPPFYSEAGDNREVYAQILSGSYAFHADAWGAISEDARALVARMLTVDDTRRATLAEVLAHPWIAANARVEHLPATVANLKAFNARRKIKAAAQAVRMGLRECAAHHHHLREVLGGATFTPAQLEDLATEFARAAGANDGAVNRERFESVMTAVGLGDLPLGRLFTLFDTDGSGGIEYRELLVGLTHFRAQDEEALRMCFKVLDADGDGSVNMSELVQLLQTWHASKATAPSAAAASAGPIATGTPDADEAAETIRLGALEKLFARMDSNADGKLSFDEFRAGLAHEPALASFLVVPLKRMGSDRALGGRAPASS